MSADNGYVIQKNQYGQYALQMYFASNDAYPKPDWDIEKGNIYQTLEDAIFGYEAMLDEDPYLSEYGLTIAGSASRRIDHALKLYEANVSKEPIKMQNFTRKPFDVEAIQVQISNLEELSQRVGGDVHKEPKGFYIQVPVRRPQSDRQSKAYVGDWLVYHQRGWKVYTNKAFTSTFVHSEAADQEHIRVTLDRLSKNVFNPSVVSADTLDQLKAVADSDGSRRSPR